MASVPLRPLPLGSSTFEVLRNSNKIYVDKTALIYELARESRKIFLSRPRRFGKTLLVSTFESLFKNGLKYFKGLEIEKLWTDNGSYRVIRLDFSSLKGFSTIDEFRHDLDKYFIQFMLREKLENPLPAQAEGLDAFTNWLAVQPYNSTVLLIDEYDTPLTACMDNAALFDAVRRHLVELYSAIKLWEGSLRFFFMTGIMKFGKASIFSELNNLTDISLFTEYSSLLGYTHNEVEKYFKDHLENAANILNTDSSQLLSELTKNYDGFCFDPNAEVHVFAPWSLLSFLTYPKNKFLNYWIDSAGNPEIIKQYLKNHSLHDPKDYFSDKYVSLSQITARAADPDQIEETTILTLAGYLTIKEPGADSFLVNYPNKEVSDSLALLYRKQLLAGKTLGQAGAFNLGRDLQSGSTERLIQQLNKLFLAMDYQKYPITDEATCRNYVQLFLTLGSGFRTYCELHNALGRSDIEVETDSVHWVLEAKFMPMENASENSAGTMLESALTQIRRKHYGESDLYGKKLIRVGFVFSEAERQIVKFDSV